MYDAASAGNVLWSSGFRQINVTDGLFSYNLGDSVAFPDSLFLNYSDIWLGVKVGANPEMSPRTRLASSAYAIKSRHADTAGFAHNVMAGSFLPLSGGTMSGAITNVGDPTITMGKGNFGSGNTNAGSNAFVAGENNSAGNTHSTVTGGLQNSASGFRSVVSGGEADSAQGDWSAVVGGYLNRATGFLSFIGGGTNNVASSDDATVSGGNSNNATGFMSTVPGGRANTASGSYATAGGFAGVASGEFSTVAGGQFNIASDTLATVSGGKYNRARGWYSTVSGGGGPFELDSNSAYGGWSAIGGGSGNRAGYYSTIGGGGENIASGTVSTVAGGQWDTASGEWSTVAGGYSNVASGRFAFVGGGIENLAADTSAAVNGGRYNKARGPYSTVSGGGGPAEADSNSALGKWTTVSGGQANKSVSDLATVSGGNLNSAAGGASVIGGGTGNLAAGIHSVVGGGLTNGAEEFGATVGGGHSNKALSDLSTISGGSFDTASGFWASIGGGTLNVATDTAATVSGGSNNKARGAYSVIGGGGGPVPADSNSASGDWSIVDGGKRNVASVASGANSAVGGGWFNKASGDYATVGGGRLDTASGIYSTVPGGFRNIAAGSYTFAAGRDATAVHDGCFVWGDNSINAAFTSTAANQFILRAGGGVGIGTNAPNGKLHIANADWTGGPVRITGNAGGSIGPTLELDATVGTAGNIYSLFSTNSGAFAGGGKFAIFHRGPTNQGYRMVIDSTGRIGINTTIPSNLLDVEAAGAVVADFNRTTNDGVIINLQQAGATEGTISVAGTTVSYNAFTGSHYGWTEEVLERGELVSLTGINQNSHDNPESEIIYGIKKSSSPNDPACLGSYLALSEPEQPFSVENPHLVMAVGNGEMWVTDESGDIEPGDYLISSSTPGHAMKDDEVKYPIGHIVARAAESIDWNSITETINGRKHKKISVLFGNFVRSNTTELSQTVALQQKQIEELFAKIAKLETSPLRSQIDN
jgi:hypothetical protein